ncbi:MAG: glycosyltransferase family 87 protein [Lysobacterales bacterium]|jgi:hypothetical protein
MTDDIGLQPRTGRTGPHSNGAAPPGFVGRLLENPARLLLAALVAVSLYGAWNYSLSMPGIDYYVAWVAADAVENGHADEIYTRLGRHGLTREYRQRAVQQDPSSRRAVAARHVQFLGATATPFMYWTVNLLSTGDYERDLRIWHALSLLCLVASVVLVGRLVGLTGTTILAILLPVLVWMLPVQSDLRVGNVNCVQLGLLSVALLLQSRDRNSVFALAAGAMVSVTVLFKPNLAPIAVLLCGYWLLGGHYGRLVLGLVGMALGALFALGVSSVFFGGISGWTHWLSSMGGFSDWNMPAGAGNFHALSLIGLDPGPLGRALTALLLCILALVAMGVRSWTARRHSSATRGWRSAFGPPSAVDYGLVLGVACVIQMLVSPLVWLHYYVLILPLFVMASRPLSAVRGAGALGLLMQRLLPLLAFLLLLDGPLAGLLDDSPAAAVNKACVLSAALLYLSGLWQLSRPPLEPAGVPAAPMKG